MPVWLPPSAHPSATEGRYMMAGDTSQFSHSQKRLERK